MARGRRRAIARSKRGEVLDTADDRDFPKVRIDAYSRLNAEMGGIYIDADGLHARRIAVPFDEIVRMNWDGVVVKGFGTFRVQSGETASPYGTLKFGNDDYASDVAILEWADGVTTTKIYVGSDSFALYISDTPIIEANATDIGMRRNVNFTPNNTYDFGVAGGMPRDINVARAVEIAGLGVAPLVLGTEAAILALSPAQVRFGFASDTNKFYVWDTSSWYYTSALTR